MSDLELTAGDLLAIADELVTGETAGVERQHGLTAKELRTWVAKGIVTPAAGGAGRGNHAVYSPVKATAVVYAARFARRVGLGAGWLRTVVATVEALGAKGLDTLRPVPGNRVLTQFGRPGIVEVRPDADGANFPAWACLARTHREVAAAVKRLRRNGERNPTGRNRGSMTKPADD